MHTNVSRELCGNVWKACGLGISRRKQIFLTIFCLHSKPLLELARMESSVLGPLFSHPHFTLWVHIHCPSPPKFIPHCFLLPITFTFPFVFLLQCSLHCFPHLPSFPLSTSQLVLFRPFFFIPWHQESNIKLSNCQKFLVIPQVPIMYRSLAEINQPELS